MTDASAWCPCGDGRPYDDCCGPLHDGSAAAPTALRLMRARYCAFALRKPDYLLDTWDPSTRPPSLELDPEVDWRSLDIVTTAGGSLLENRGTVEFRAGYRRGRADRIHHEVSRFVRNGSRWVYVGPV